MARPRTSRPRGNIRDVSGGRGTKWLVRVSLGPDDMTGKRPRIGKVVHGPRKEAQQWLTEQLAKYDTGGLTEAPRKLTLGTWMEEYRVTYRQDVEARTRQDTDWLIEKRLRATPLWGRLLTALTPPEVQAWVNTLSQSGLGPRSVRMAYGVLRHALGQAVVLGYLPRNPATIGIKLPKQERRRPRAFTWEEAQRFLDAARQDRWYPLFLLLLTAGLRPGEAFALCWDDLEGDQLRVRRALVRLPKQPYRLKATKTDRARTVPLPAVTLQALAEYRAALPPTLLAPEAFMFTNADGEPLDHGNLAFRHFKPILRRAKLPPRRLYDLRHSCATLLLQAGEHVKVVAERLGHADVTLTLNTYTDVLQGMQEKAATRFDEHLKPGRVLKLA
jgi:integrase